MYATICGTIKTCLFLLPGVISSAEHLMDKFVLANKTFIHIYIEIILRLPRTKIWFILSLFRDVTNNTKVASPKEKPAGLYMEISLITNIPLLLYNVGIKRKIYELDMRLLNLYFWQWFYVSKTKKKSYSLLLAERMPKLARKKRNITWRNIYSTLARVKTYYNNIINQNT